MSRFERKYGTDKNRSTVATAAMTRSERIGESRGRTGTTAKRTTKPKVIGTEKIATMTTKEGRIEIAETEKLIRDEKTETSIVRTAKPTPSDMIVPPSEPETILSVNNGFRMLPIGAEKYEKATTTIQTLTNTRLKPAVRNSTFARRLDPTKPSIGDYRCRSQYVLLNFLEAVFEDGIL